MYGYIYCATSPVNKRYYGLTLNFENRKKRHIKESLIYKNECCFHRAIRKYGINNINWSIVETIENDNKKILLETLYIKEKSWIEKDKTHLREFGYNMTKGGSGGDTFSFRDDKSKDITRKRLSEKLKNPSQEIRNKRSKSLKGLKRTELAKNNISKGKLGIKNTKEHNENVSKSLKILYKDKIYYYNSKSVDMYDLELNFIETFPSISIAHKKTGHRSSTICDICKGKKHYVCNHIFKYHED